MKFLLRKRRGKNMQEQSTRLVNSLTQVTKEHLQILNT